MWLFIFLGVFTIGNVCKRLYRGAVSQTTFIQRVFFLIAIWFHYLLMSSLITSSLINKTVFQVSSSLIVNILWCFHTNSLWWKLSSFTAAVRRSEGKRWGRGKYATFSWNLNGLRLFVLTDWDWLKYSYFVLNFLQHDSLRVDF